MEKAKGENRKKGPDCYYERHHIVPDFMFVNRKRKGPKGHLPGNPNDPKNMVLLTPREHILSHILLAKALKGKRYWAQAASSVMFFYTKVMGMHPRQKNKLPGIMHRYEKYRIMGLQGISESRKGKFPAKDAKTGKSVGSVDCNHHNVKSGKWVHVTKGRVWAETERKNRPRQIGTANNNYKEMTPERRERVFSVVSRSLVDEKYLNIKTMITNLKAEFCEFNKISNKWILNNFESYSLLVDCYNLTRDANIVYNPYYRSKEHRHLCAIHQTGKRWITNGVTSKMIPIGSEIPEEFKPGRTQ